MKQKLVALGLVLGVCAAVFATLYQSPVAAARNSSGTHSLPAGNPVVSGSSISSTWANNTISDLSTEITNSLDRNGRGAMLAALKLYAGTVSAPGLSFSAETTSGLYRAGAGDIRASVSSTDTLKLTSTAVLPLVQTQLPAGTVGAPSLAFSADTGVGLYRAGSADVRAAVAGADVMKLGTGAVTFPANTQFGAVASPTMTIIGNATTPRIVGGGSSSGISIYGNPGGTGTNGTIVFRNNQTDGNARVTIDTDSANYTLTTTGIVSTPGIAITSSLYIGSGLTNIGGQAGATVASGVGCFCQSPGGYPTQCQVTGTSLTFQASHGMPNQPWFYVCFRGS